jgi:deoxycytidine triphosphate deaminase
MFWGNKERVRLDRATYKLRVGPKVYVSPTGVGSDQKNKTKLKLDLGRDFLIPAGQFAFLLTEETVTVPEDALAFISIRAKYEFRGLVNVSGFHVDPGFTGRLVFSVFNAGPGEVYLERCEECFHIWFAGNRASNRQGRHELHQPKASGRGASTDSPAAPPSDDDATLRAAIERVIMSRTTIEIELAEAMTSDDQNRILIIPWTPPSPHRRREIIPLASALTR